MADNNNKKYISQITFIGTEFVEPKADNKNDEDNKEERDNEKV